MSVSVPEGDGFADIEQVKSFRDFLMSYNKLSEICFADCVWDFTTRSVKGQEIIANENAMAAAQKAGAIPR
ncbi:Mitochondrial import inner membrane translocase subunit Tim9 [Blattella germanica]|nr:Mitochondrial import inner membrane translocase subunit Tim9 [Blattella germanica]